MMKTVAFLLLLTCLCSGQDCPPVPNCNVENKIYCPGPMGLDGNGCPFVGECIDKHKGLAKDGRQYCPNFCLPPLLDGQVLCPPTYDFYGCMNHPTVRQSASECPTPQYDSDGCLLPVTCGDEERKCMGPKSSCCPREEFCMMKYINKLGRDGITVECDNHCYLEPIPPNQLLCSQTYDSRGCPEEPQYVNERDDCRTSIYDDQGCYESPNCDIMSQKICVDQSVPTLTGCGPKSHKTFCIPNTGSCPEEAL